MKKKHYRAYHIFPWNLHCLRRYSSFWNVPYKRAHTTEKTAPSRSWKKTATAIRVVC